MSSVEDDAFDTYLDELYPSGGFIKKPANGKNGSESKPVASVPEENQEPKVMVEKDGEISLVDKREYDAAINSKRGDPAEPSEPKKEAPVQREMPETSAKQVDKDPPPVVLVAKGEDSKDAKENRNNGNDKSVKDQPGNHQQQTAGQVQQPGKKKSNKDRKESYLAWVNRKDQQDRGIYKPDPLPKYQPRRPASYRSPYERTNVVYRPVESPEEIERKRQNAENRKKMSEQMYQRWFNDKTEHIEYFQKYKNEEKDRLFSSRPRSLSYRPNAKKLSYEEWLDLKVEKYKREREFESHLFELNMIDRTKVTPEERADAVKRWRQRKSSERMYQRQLRSLEDEMWLGRARRSRKHRSLYEARYTDISYSHLRAAGLVD